ncbi:hypothetical protein PPTG_07245 [Phytophthora nicotianae INRA-310]|uniref:Uncharacterized protein n=1 Tax=Phytophthora nicotianae (strain INRA-310) TaxID=761204 RepID=W2QPA4_PHYN3|nr:hypothetical protein PPTG_07245 [Phytophthora nicotianae INRA-310]ETN15027.1 hypothetical protein PPTG_07245 [Phytophthora nicotianae INRA-310]
MSSGKGAIVDLTSSPWSSRHSTARSGPATVSTVELANPSPDLAGVRASLSALQLSIDQVEALRELRSDHFDNSCELETCRLRYRDLKLRYNEAVSEFQDRTSTLEAQLAAASSFGVIVPPETARRIADLESQLARSQSDLQVARDRQSALASELRESATSHKAAQAEVVRLEAAIKHKTRRLLTLSDNYERRLRVADTTIATHSTELNRVQDQVSTLDRDLQKASQRVQAAISQRDQAMAERTATQDRVSARDTIARLEKRINQVKKSQKLHQDFELALATLRQERDSLVVQRAELLGQLGERFMESTRVPKAARSTPGPFPAAALTQGPASRSSIEVLSAVAAGQKSEGPVPSPSFTGPHDHLPRSARSTTKGGSGGASSSPAASEVGAHSDGGESYSGKFSSIRVFDSDAVGSDSGSPELSRGRNQFGMPSGPLSDAELADLPRTTVPRSEWIPGYRDCRSFRSHDIVPWSA